MNRLQGETLAKTDDCLLGMDWLLTATIEDMTTERNE